MIDHSQSGFSVKRSIPVVRMLDEEKTRMFYIDYLGFEVDWEHRFNDDANSPLYMQIHLGEAFVHLNGHADADSPTCEVRFPVNGIERYCNYLRSKDAEYEKPEVVDPRFSGRKTDMNVIDPSGNLLTFWSPDEPGLELGEEFYSRPLLFANDIALSVQYYCDKLGFRKDWGYEEDVAIVAQVSRNGLDLILATESALPRPAVPSVLSLSLHDAEGLNTLYQDLSDRGARIVKPPFKVSWAENTFQFDVEDPDGNILTFWGDGS